MKKSTINSVAEPVAYVTKRKQRIKQHDNNTVYLNNGDEFEIELFNPQTCKVLAKIELNGVAIGSGIVLRPGERVFLERYLDKAKKFLFETYTVSGNNDDVKKAIENNGSLMVKFYQEDISSYLINLPSPTIGGGWNNYNYGYPLSNYGSGTYNLCGTSNNTLSNQPIGGTSSSVNAFFTSTATVSNAGTGMVQPTSMTFTNSSATMDSLSQASQQTKSPLRQQSLAETKSIETGRIEAGSHSSQSFSYDSTKFYTWYTWTSSWKILPVSQKAIVKEDLKVYCTECGAKRKKDSHKFCPTCGSKF